MVSKPAAERYKRRIGAFLRKKQKLQMPEPTPPSGKNFLQRKFRVLTLLQAALQSHEKEVRGFLNAFPYPSLGTQKKSKSYINRLRDRELQSALREYVFFALRFGVRCTLAPTDTVFGVESTRIAGTKFWAKIVKGQLVPRIGMDLGLPELVNFADEEVGGPAGAESLFESGKLKWFVINDPMQESLLARIEEIAYDPDAIVFIAHCSRRHQTFLFCLVGENVNDHDWKKGAARLKTRFQQEQYNTATRGRTPDLKQRGTEYEALQKPEPLKSIAVDLVNRAAASPDSATLKQVDSKSRALRRRKSELKKRE